MSLLRALVPGPRAAERTHRGVHFVLPFLLAGVGWNLATAVQANHPASCAYTAPYLPAPWLMFSAIVALLAGRYLSHLAPHAQFRPSQAGSAVVGQLGLVCLFVLLTLVWFVEALGTTRVAVGAGASEMQPITYYVRCAIYHDRASTGIGWWSMGVVSLICFLAGHWLWSSHRELRRPDARGGAPKTLA